MICRFCHFKSKKVINSILVVSNLLSLQTGKKMFTDRQQKYFCEMDQVVLAIGGEMSTSIAGYPYGIGGSCTDEITAGLYDCEQNHDSCCMPSIGRAEWII